MTVTVEELQAKLEAMEQSNSGLKADLAKAKAKARGADIDPEAHAQLQTDYDTLKAAHAKLEAGSKAQIDKLTQSLTEIDGKFKASTIDAALSGALNDAKVDPKYIAAVTALFKGQAAIDGDAVKVGDKALAEAVKEWAAGEAGAPFISASQNAGGGAAGGGAGAAGVANPYAKDTLNLTKQIELQKSNPTLAAQFKAQADNQGT